MIHDKIYTICERVYKGIFYVRVSLFVIESNYDNINMSLISLIIYKLSFMSIKVVNFHLDQPQQLQEHSSWLREQNT